MQIPPPPCLPSIVVTPELVEMEALKKLATLGRVPRTLAVIPCVALLLPPLLHGLLEMNATLGQLPLSTSP